MIIELVRNYINLSEQGVEGGNISETMTSIESGLEKVETSLKQYLDDMFENDRRRTDYLQNDIYETFSAVSAEA